MTSWFVVLFIFKPFGLENLCLIGGGLLLITPCSLDFSNEIYISAKKSGLSMFSFGSLVELIDISCERFCFKMEMESNLNKQLALLLPMAAFLEDDIDFLD